MSVLNIEVLKSKESQILDTARFKYLTGFYKTHQGWKIKNKKDCLAEAVRDTTNLNHGDFPSVFGVELCDYVNMLYNQVELNNIF